MVSDCTVSCQDNRMFCLVDQCSSLVNAAEGCIFFGAFWFADRNLGKSWSYLHFCNVGWQINVAGTWLFAFCIFKGNPHDLIYRIRIYDLFATLGDGRK